MTPYLIILGAGFAPDDGLPYGVQQVTVEKRILDWQLDAFAGMSPEVSFVGGYDIDSVIKHFPKLNYHYSDNWRDTGAVESLCVALEAISERLDSIADLYIAYSDILFRPELVDHLSNARSKGICVCIDDFHSTREQLSAKTAETIRLEEKQYQFVGLVRVPKDDLVAFSKVCLGLRPSMKGVNLGQLLQTVTEISELCINALPAGELWAHAEQGRSVARFVLGTKAVTLSRLRGRLNQSEVLPLEYFTRAEWLKHGAAVVEKLLNRFGEETCLVVRSSAIDEDGFVSANAGCYHSELDVSAEKNSLRSAIVKVFDSYTSSNPNDQVLVQPQLENVLLSGVIFTRTLDVGAPYTVINYVEGGDTTAVTGGSESSGVKLYVSRSIPDSVLASAPILWKRLINFTREIEQCVFHDELDIEFAVDSTHKIYTLQVRPLMVNNKNLDRGADCAVFDALIGVASALKRFEAAPVGQVGNSAWSVMADWNPAEIIGLCPSPLALDLYRTLVTDRVWAQQRFEVGYRDIRGWPLVRSFAGQAFVDVRASLNSFIPADIPANLAERMVNFGVARLRSDPSLHDKVEFELLPTCLDFDFDDKWSQRYTTADLFSAEEVLVIRQSLAKVTREIIARTSIDLDASSQLESVCCELEQVREPFGDWLRRTITICSDNGVLHFAHLARAGFVVAAILNSAVVRGLLSEERRIAFMESIEGVGGMLTKAAESVRAGELDREEFIKRFGHLRPGTYDINSSAYRDSPEIYIDPIIETSKSPTQKVFLWSAEERLLLSEAFLQLDIGLNPDTFLDFATKAVFGREYSKFVFTRLLSSMLEALEQHGVAAGIARSKLESMPLAFWLEKDISIFGDAESSANLMQWTEQRSAAHRLSTRVVLPPVVFGPDCVHLFQVPSSEPTFITVRQAKAELRIVHLNEMQSQDDIRGRVVAITHADPGFDYLFAMGISGLITAYGGPNSHMAIRASEFSIPAVIGVGEENFATLKDGIVIDLDCRKRKWSQEAQHFAS